jgi:hypothetical protein
MRVFSDFNKLVFKLNVRICARIHFGAGEQISYRHFGFVNAFPIYTNSSKNPA